LETPERQGMLVGKCEFNSNRRLMWTELYYTPKRCHLKRTIGSIISYCSREDPVALLNPTRVIERSAEIKPENRIFSDGNYSLNLRVKEVIL